MQGFKKVDDFLPWRLYNTLFSKKGVKDEDRGTLWVKLLKAEEYMNGASPNMYYKLLSMENQALEKKIDADQISTRSELKQSGGK